VATPTYLHKQIVLDAIAAGKHVYCEAPLAVTMDDLKAICGAAKAAKTVFQPGLQRHCHPLNKRVNNAMSAGSCKQLVSIESKSRQKVDWQLAGATPERAKERSWRIYSATSLGPVGELGIHQIDFCNWMALGKPVAVRGMGTNQAHGDAGYEVPDTTFVTLEYPNQVLAFIESTIASSHGGNREEIVGIGGTILVRDAGEKSMGYLFKEAGTETEGWEPYAKRETIDDEIGIILRATPPGGFSIEKVEHGDFGVREPLYYALGSFLKRCCNGKAPLVDAKRAYWANVIAIRAAEAVAKGTRIPFQAEDFTLA